MTTSASEVSEVDFCINSLLELPLENPRRYYNSHQTTSFTNFYTEGSKHAIKCTGEVMSWFLYVL